MKRLKMIELFAGIRAMSLASEWIGGFETVEAVEINPYCNQKMLKLGVTENTIANWEQGRSGFKQFARVVLLCHALNCSPDELTEVIAS